MRMRITVVKTASRTDDVRVASDVRRDLWAHSPVEVDPDHPLHGTHRDKDGRAYFEFATTLPQEVRRIVERDYSNSVEVSENPPPPAEECANCGNVVSTMQPSVCP